MQRFPDTRQSLLVRLADREDEQAWEEFVTLYRPLILRLLRRRGLQDADADELAQDVLLAAAAAAERWRSKSDRRPFRACLSGIARNMAVNLLTRTRHRDRGLGGSGFRRLLEDRSFVTPKDEVECGLEYRREVFAWAAERVRGEFHGGTWKAFWRTCVEGHSIRETAEDLGVSCGSVYLARSRVMARLRREVSRFDGETHEPDAGGAEE